MKITIPDIPDEGLSLNIDEKISTGNSFEVSPVSAHLEMHKIGREIIINGRVKTEMKFQCSRCLQDFDRDLDIPVSVVYHPIDEMHLERHELKDDEMDMSFYKGDVLDLQDMLEEQIMLNMQMKPLCDENCKGICPKCGRDLNVDVCHCENKETDSRLEVLKNLLEKRKE